MNGMINFDKADIPKTTLSNYLNIFCSVTEQSEKNKAACYR